MIFSHARLEGIITEIKDKKRYDDFVIIAAYKHPNWFAKAIFFRFRDHKKAINCYDSKIMDIIMLFEYRGPRTTKYNKCKILENKFNIIRIPYYQKNPVIMKMSIDAYCDTISLFPEDLITHEIIIHAIHANSIKFIPDHILTKNEPVGTLELRSEQRMKFQANQGLKFQAEHRTTVSEHRILRSDDYILMAVEHFANSLKDVPTHLITQEIVNIAFSKGCNMTHIPDNMLTYEMAEHYVRNDHSNITFIPERLKTPELIALADSLRGYQQ